jgi:hypothetical protein
MPILRCILSSIGKIFMRPWNISLTGILQKPVEKRYTKFSIFRVEEALPAEKCPDSVILGPQ